MVYVPPTDSDAIAYLQSPQAIRDRSGLLWQWAIEQRLPYFTVDMSRLDAVADYVMQVTQQHYPTWNVPFHSRWRHFEAGGIPRLEHFQQQISSLSAVEQARGLTWRFSACCWMREPEAVGAITKLRRA